jgi:hypothetical protein
MKPTELVNKAAKVNAEAELVKARREAASWKEKHCEAIGEVNDLQAKIEAMSSISECKSRGMVKCGKSKPSGVAAIVPATDWHVEETITLESTSEKNFFNLEEAERRIAKFYSKIVELIEWQNHLAPVCEIWHPLLGDLLTGYIHEELIETNSLSPTEACVFLQDKICSGIDMLLRETRLPVYVPTCVGNHGRTTIKKRIKTSYANSYEWLLYMTLAKRYEKNPRVQFMVGKGYHNIQTIMGRKVRFHHGDGLRYQGGVGGITIPVNKSIAQWNKACPVDFDIFGHWHSFLWGYNNWISCGSLMGYSEYSVEIKADFQHPTQTFIIMDRRYGLTQATPIFLTKPSRK